MPRTFLTVCINRCTELGSIGPDAVVVLIVDTEGAKDAAGGVIVGVGGVGAGGPGGVSGSTEVRAVVPGGGGQGAGLRGIVGDGGSGPHGGPHRELREVGDVGELRTQKHKQIDAWSATAHRKVAGLYVFSLVQGSHLPFKTDALPPGVYVTLIITIFGGMRGKAKKRQQC